MNEAVLRERFEKVVENWSFDKRNDYNTAFGMLEYDVYSLANEVLHGTAYIYHVNEYIGDLMNTDLTGDYIDEEKENCRMHDLVVVTSSANYYF